MKRVIWATWLLLAPLVHATEESPSPWSGDAELGYVSSEGNTEAKNITVNAALVWERRKWKNNSELQALNTKSAGVRSAEKYYLSNRLSYTFSENNYTFNFISWEDDRFSGYRFKATAAIGYGRRLIDRENMYWDAELGPGYRHAEFLPEIDKENEKEVIYRLASSFRWNLSETAIFEQKISAEGGNDNTVAKSATSIKTTVKGGIGLKISYLVNYTDKVPDEKVHTDKQTTITLVYSF